MRPLESLLIVILTGLGTGVLITVLSLLIGQFSEYRRSFDTPDYRIIRIYRESETVSLDQSIPLALVGSAEKWETAILDSRSKRGNAADEMMSLDEIEELQRRLPDFLHVFLEERRLGSIPMLSDVPASEMLPILWGSENDVLVIGTSPEYFAFMILTSNEGNVFVQADLQKENRVVILTDEMATVLFGEADPLGQTVPIIIHDQEPIPYTVIGVLAPSIETMGPSPNLLERRFVYVPATTLDTGTRRDKFSFDQVLVGVDTGVDLDQASEKVRQEALLLWGSSVRVQNSLELYQEGLEQWRGTSFVNGVFASVSLLISVISILGLMLNRVLKRSETVGLAMALGAPRNTIFRQFMVEAFLLGLLGSIFGIVFAIVLTSQFENDFFTVFGTQVFVGVSIGCLASLFFGVYPAYLGSQVNPVDALRAE